MNSSARIFLHTGLTVIALSITQISFAKEVASEPAAIMVAPDTARVPAQVDGLNAVIPQDDKLTKGELANGLKYYILPNNTPSNKAEIRLVVQAGSLNEQDNERGLAHFMEHMVFNGTKNFPKHEMINTLQKMGVVFGADLNAQTGQDDTTYILPIPLNDPKNLSTAMQVLEDWAFNASLDADEIDKERPVITEEWRSSTLNPESRQRDKMLGALAKDSLYTERHPIGDIGTIKNFDPDVLRAFYKRWYRPNLMSVVVVGDVNAAKTKALIEQHFNPYRNPANPAVLKTVTVPNNVEPIIEVFQDPELTQNTVMLAYKDKDDVGIDTTTGDYIRNLRESLISQMINKRLQAQLDAPNAPFIMAMSSRDNIVSSKKAYILFAGAAPNQQADALKALHDEGLRVVQHGFSTSELELAKKQMFANIEDYYLNRQKVESGEKAAEYIRGITENEPLPTIPWEYEAQKKYLPTITIEQINRMAKEHFGMDNRVAFIAGSSADKPLSTAQVRSIIGAQDNVAPYVAVEQASALLSKMPKAGKVVRTNVDQDTGVTTWTLANGVKVSYKTNGYNDNQIQFSAFADGGTSLLSDDEWRQSQWALNAIDDSGLNGLSKVQVSQLLTGKTVDVNFDVDEDSHGLAGAFAPQDSEIAFQLMYSKMTGVNKDPEAFENYKKRSMAVYANADKDRNRYFNNQVEWNINRNNPRFGGTYPTAESWQETNYDTTYKAYQRIYGNANGMHFTFFGKIVPTELRRLSETYLGSLPSDTSTESRYQVRPFREDYSSRTIAVKKGTDKLSQVRIMFGGETYFNTQENLAMVFAGEVLTERLISQLREVQGGVYSANAYGGLRQRPNESYSFGIEFPCAPERADALTQSALDQLQALIDEGPSELEMKKVREATIAHFSQERNSNEFGVGQYVNAIKYGNDPASIRTFEARLAALTASDVQAVAAKYLSSIRVIAVLKPE